MKKVAIATTDGINIDEHFGRTKEFLIYELNEQGSYKLLEHRENNTACSNEHQNYTSATTVLFADINVVLAKKIGPGASRALHEQGVVAFSLTGSIDKALKAYAKRGKLLEINTSRLV